MSHVKKTANRSFTGGKAQPQFSQFISRIHKGRIDGDSYNKVTKAAYKSAPTNGGVKKPQCPWYRPTPRDLL